MCVGDSLVLQTCHGIKGCHMENAKCEMWSSGCKVMRAAREKMGNDSSVGAESNSVFLLEEEDEELGKT